MENGLAAAIANLPNAIPNSTISTGIRRRLRQRGGAPHRLNRKAPGFQTGEVEVPAGQVNVDADQRARHIEVEDDARLTFSPKLFMAGTSRAKKTKASRGSRRPAPPP